jgi:septum formation topological specificity factor MinE
MLTAAVLCVITMLRVDWDKEALKAKERLQVILASAHKLLLHACIHGT